MPCGSMPGHEFRCEQCGKGANYRFCGNDCFKAYSRTRVGIECAICRYRGELLPPGGHSSNRICPECRNDPANVGWRRTPRHERNGFDADVFEAAATAIEQVQSRAYRAGKAISIVRLMAGGDSSARIAELVGCSVPYVKKVAAYWNRETNGLLSKIRTEARRDAKKDTMPVAYSRDPVDSTRKDRRAMVRISGQRPVRLKRTTDR